MNKISQICRTCLNQTNDSIFQVIIDNDIEIPLIVMLSECIGIEISEEDEISLNICDDCAEQVISMYRFRKQCLESEKKLLQELLHSKLKKKDNSFDKNQINNINSKIDAISTNIFKEVINDYEMVQNMEIHEIIEDDQFSPIPSDDPLEDELIEEITKNELRHECPTCLRRFKRHYNMKRHMQVHDPPEKRIRSAEVDLSLVFVCHLCDHEFVSKNHLNDHLLTHTGNTIDINTKNFPHECPKCQKCFKRRYNLKKHMETHEPPETRVRVKRKAYVFICDYCGHKFGYKNHLRQHLHKHTGEKPYKCDLCPYSSAYYGGLKLHKRSHSDEKPYKCKFCEKRFKTPTARSCHHSNHSIDSPFECNVCLKKYRNRDNLRRHKVTHALANKHMCPYCDKIFSRKQHLDDHIEHLHKKESEKDIVVAINIESN